MSQIATASEHNSKIYIKVCSASMLKLVVGN